MEANIIFKEDWKVLTRFLPPGWMKMGRELGAFKRSRGFKSVNVLLRILLIHLADSCSLRQATARAKLGNIADVSDVALLKRLKSSSKWLQWMTLELIKVNGISLTPPAWLKNYFIKSVDASVVSEPGSTGTDWRLHYSLDLFSLSCNQFIISRPDVGESFINFKVQEKDLLLGDRIYGRLKGLCYVKDNGGDFIARFKTKAFSLSKQGEDFELAKELAVLNFGEVGNWDLEGYTKSGLSLSIRLCAIRKTEEETEKSIKKAKRAASKQCRKLSAESLELCKYVILVTSLPNTISAQLILELYRFRWQVEIVFKRLKSILGFGHLPKKEEDSCRAWLQGKLFVAQLSQRIVNEGRFFSPWGYPIK